MQLETTMRMNRFALVATLSVLAAADALVGAARAADTPWLTDFKAAREQAAKDGKDTDQATALKLVDAYIADNKLSGVAAQEIQLLKLDLFKTSSAADCDPVIKLMDEIIALDPASALAGGATNAKNQATSRKKKLEQDAATKAGAK
jgi:hypothetical protein